MSSFFSGYISLFHFWFISKDLCTFTLLSNLQLRVSQLRISQIFYQLTQLNYFLLFWLNPNLQLRVSQLRISQIFDQLTQLNYFINRTNWPNWPTENFSIQTFNSEFLKWEFLKFSTNWPNPNLQLSQLRISKIFYQLTQLNYFLLIWLNPNLQLRVSQLIISQIFD